MRVLIAEDDGVSRHLLQATLANSGYEVVPTEDGQEAWEILQSDDPPRLAVLDWMMPRMDGVEVCQRVREFCDAGYIYIIFLTAKDRTSDIVRGLEAGADDYLIKPFNADELRSRLVVGTRILSLEQALDSKVRELEEAMTHVKQLQGLLPICMYCKNIRDDSDSWHRLESYIEKHSQAMFTHSLCNDCLAKHYPNHKGIVEDAPVE